MGSIPPAGTIPLTHWLRSLLFCDLQRNRIDVIGAGPNHDVEYAGLHNAVHVCIKNRECVVHQSEFHCGLLAWPAAIAIRVVRESSRGIAVESTP